MKAKDYIVKLCPYDSCPGYLSMPLRRCEGIWKVSTCAPRRISAVPRKSLNNKQLPRSFTPLRMTGVGFFHRL